jgi:quinol monooxygenase YgiN
VTAIVLSARVVAHPSARRELLQALLDWAAMARHSTGALVSNVYEDAEASAVFGLVAEWESTSALEAHLRSDAFGVLLGALELLARPARLTVARAADEYGTDALPAIRRLRESGRAGAERPGAA